MWNEVDGVDGYKERARQRWSQKRMEVSGDAGWCWCPLRGVHENQEVRVMGGNSLHLNDFDIGLCMNALETKIITLSDLRGKTKTKQTP